MKKLLILGSGLTGLFTAALALDRGADVTLVSQGRGGLSLSHGCVDIWGRAAPSRAIGRLRESHPYRLAGKDALQHAVVKFKDIARESHYPFQGDLSSPLLVPTSLGAIHRTCLAPISLAQADLHGTTPIFLVNLKGFRDFYPALITRNLLQAGVPMGDEITLPLPNSAPPRDLYASDYARHFDDANWRSQALRLWKPLLRGLKRIGFPAVLGLRFPNDALHAVQDMLGAPIFEIPTLPPSVPGLRLERILRRRILHSGANIIDGSRAIGRIEAKKKKPIVRGVIIETAGGPRPIDADVVILATGGMLHGGLVADRKGRVRESVFDLPVCFNPAREKWTSASPFHQQDYATFGVIVDSDMRPLDADGLALFTNLFAAGGLLAGADRTMEASRQGIDLATSYRAVEVALS
jgi:glycerol-3-phosphate dehydrogenase subunit B